MKKLILTFSLSIAPALLFAAAVPWVGKQQNSPDFVSTGKLLVIEQFVSSESAPTINFTLVYPAPYSLQFALKVLLKDYVYKLPVPLRVPEGGRYTWDSGNGYALGTLIDATDSLLRPVQ